MYLLDHSNGTAEESVGPLTINIIMVGSRGDVQPFVVLGQALQEHGHRVRLGTHLVFSDFAQQNGLEFFNIGGDPGELMSFMVNNFQSNSEEDCDVWGNRKTPKNICVSNEQAKIVFWSKNLSGILF